MNDNKTGALYITRKVRIDKISSACVEYDELGYDLVSSTHAGYNGVLYTLIFKLRKTCEKDTLPNQCARCGYVSY